MPRMTTNQSVERGLELLSELLAMKSKVDGVPRSPVGVIGPKEGYDLFSFRLTQGNHRV
jgi:hypothetical protein